MSKKFFIIDNLGNKYKSIHAAARALGISAEPIRKVLLGKFKQINAKHLNFKWKATT